MFRTLRYCFYLPFLFIATSIAHAGADSAKTTQPFSIDDYFRIQRVTELALSSDGEWLAYAVERNSLEENKLVRTVYISKATSDAAPIFIETIQNARNLVWIPRTHELAFLSGDKKAVSQVFSFNIENERLFQYTRGDDSVAHFQFTLEGSALAWLTERDSPTDNGPSFLYERMRDGDGGIVVDYENAWYQHFVNPNFPDFTTRPSTGLWIKERGSEAYQVNIPGDAKRFYWSSDGSKLSIVYIGTEIPEKPFFNRFTSVGYYDAKTKRFVELADAQTPAQLGKSLRHYIGGKYYDGGEWGIGKDTLFVRRIFEPAAGHKRTSWTSVDTENTRTLDGESVVWHEIEMYGPDEEPAFIPISKKVAYSTKTVHAHQFLYKISPLGVGKAGILRGVNGSVSLVRLSADFETAVFVNQTPIHPPGIYLWKNGIRVEAIRHLNTETTQKQMPNVREVTWRGRDGVTVQGWLLEPVDEDHHKPWPLITFVHGGPSIAMTDEFALYFLKYGGIWPYPLEVWALNGMAVFVPNYRGTGTFGDEFAEPDHLDGEPVNDILSGIDHLIAAGTADLDRLGIAGHSHGAWLGPLVMTKKRFRAASFAEGYQNIIVSYELMAMYVSRVMRDEKLGVSLYDSPQRYIDLSPSLHFDGVDTAILFEAGARNAAILMKGSAKAAAYAGMPTEYVVYPKTGHNLQIPHMQKESAERNLDWFRFWLRDEEDPNPKKEGQYVRWRKLRSE